MWKNQHQLTLTNHGYLTSILMMRRDRFEKLGKLGEVLITAGVAAAKTIEKENKVLEEEAIKRLKSAGGRVLREGEFAFEEPAEEMWRQYLDKHGKAGHELIELIRAK